MKNGRLIRENFQIERLMFNEGFQIEQTGTQIMVHSYYDTFDFLLYQQSYYLYEEDERFYLYNETEDTVYPIRETKKMPFYNSGHFENHRELLKKIIGNRALLPVLSLEIEICNFIMTNSDQKTVARIKQVKFQKLNEGETLIFVEQLKGYKKEVKMLEEALQPYLGGKISSLQQHFFTTKIAHFDYTTRINIKIKSRDTLDTVVCKILKFYLDVIQKNIHGILEDIDIEFLHDFRVGLRKTRSLLVMLKKEIDPWIYRDFKQRFKKIMQKTNNQRDIDVYLDEEDYFRSLVPPEYFEDLHSFFLHLKKGRKNELRKIRRHFNTKFFRETFMQWNDLISSENGPLLISEKAKMPVKEYASGKLKKLIKRLANQAQKIMDHEIPETVHDCRILCKQIRYISEIFAPLFSEGELKYFIAVIKKFQEFLGAYNDAHMQKAMISRYQENIRNGREGEALEQLVPALEKKQEDNYLKFIQTFEQNKGVILEFRRLIS